MKTTLIGSLPHKDAELATALIFEYISIPCWAQLPKRNFKEQMHVQYSQNFPGIIIEDNTQKIYLNKEKFYLELENFYEKIINKIFEYFVITPEFSLGIYEFKKYIDNNIQTSQIKLQTIGPITFGLTLKDETNQAIFYDDQIKEAIIKHLSFKSLWQVRYLLNSLNSRIKEIILFYDEPYLAAYGSAFSAISKEDILNSLQILLQDTKFLIKQFYPNINLKIGIHCCANTDWSLLTSLDELDIISFDAYDFFKDFSLYIEDIKKFTEKNKIIAWGIIPNTEKIFSENSQTILEKLKNFIEILYKKSLNKELLVKNLIITPQCGLANSKEEVTKRVLEICNELNKMNYEVLL
ncbi:MAG: hypothetical protein RMJ67_07240 [Elusimicrobiota bacterium]|nr:hypothetical protein [Endomicrobiia bacterium]MDW8166287.1 hypothetical protein [Elusimicrobiota bacterium]